MTSTKVLVLVVAIAQLGGCAGLLNPAGSSPYLPIPAMPAIPAVVFRAGQMAEQPADKAAPPKPSALVPSAQDPPRSVTAKGAQADKVVGPSTGSPPSPSPSQVGQKQPDAGKPRPADFF